MVWRAAFRKDFGLALHVSIVPTPVFSSFLAVLSCRSGVIFLGDVVETGWLAGRLDGRGDGLVHTVSRCSGPHEAHRR